MNCPCPFIVYPLCALPTNIFAFAGTVRSEPIGQTTRARVFDEPNRYAGDRRAIFVSFEEKRAKETAKKECDKEEEKKGKRGLNLSMD